MQSKATTLAGLLVILLGGLILFQGLLLPADRDAIYPWSSDAWGHLIKAEYLNREIAEGNLYPDLFPGWYSGIQMLRYHAPLPYYLLVGIYTATGNIWWAGNLFLFLASLGGGLTFLLYRRWMGWVGAVATGVLFMALHDNLRVAFAEGNLPRVLATALLPLTFYFFLKLITLNGRRRDFVGVAICIGLVVLSHTMMAAIFLVCCSIFAISHWIIARTSSRTVTRAGLALATGVMLSGWWLMPGLTGGITEIDQESASEAMARFPLISSLNPALRSGNEEAYYLGLSMVLGLALAVVFWKQLPTWSRSLLVTALITTLISSTVANEFYKALPLHQLFWPIRFLSFAGFAMLLVTMAVAACMWNQPVMGRFNLYRWAAAALMVALIIDFNPSLGMAHGRELPRQLVQFSQRLKELPGWRVATVDLSRLGSAPSYLFTELGSREQVFGWAYQGSITAPLLARINQAVANGYHSYAVDRLTIQGTDDVVLLNQPDIPGDFAQALQAAGFRLDRDAGDLELYHRDGAPRAYTISHKMLGIGKGAQNLAVVFPEVMVGSTEYLDDYDEDFLARFDGLYISGFRWRDKAAAEQLIRNFLDHGGRTVLVDLTGVPNDILSKQPKFLEVYGEPVLSIFQASLDFGDRELPLKPFDREHLPWVTQTPQGLDETLVSFRYPVSDGVALGVKNLGEHRVHFIGLNLPFHALVTHDPVAIGLLGETLGLVPGQMPDRQAIPIDNYQARDWGYAFDYEIAEDTQVLIPVAHHSGTRVYVDGERTPSRPMDRLTLTTLRAGAHQVQVRSEKTPIYWAGWMTTALGGIVLLAYTAGLVRPSLPTAWRQKGRVAYAANG